MAQASSSLPPLDGGGIAELERDLKPGQFLWIPQASPAGPVMVVVALATQRAYAYRNGVLIGISTASTGKAGHATPTGVFTILQKQVDHKSNLYSSAPMPFMQRLTWDGIAMHAGNLPGYPASHGCVRLPVAFAKLLYGVTGLGLTVVITDQQDVPRIAPTPTVLTQSALPMEAAQEAWRWQPAKAASGPISILISVPDRRLIVLRNGVQIGSSSIKIAKGPTQTAIYTLRTADAAGFHWLHLRLPGEPTTAGADLSAEERARLTMPEKFRVQLAVAIVPGTTVIVTNDSLLAGGLGRKLTVLATED